MNTIEVLRQQIKISDLSFSKKPILIGGMAMEYYGMRKAGADIDLVICDVDYQKLALENPEKRKDLWGDYIKLLPDDLSTLYLLAENNCALIKLCTQHSLTLQ